MRGPFVVSSNLFHLRVAHDSGYIILTVLSPPRTLIYTTTARVRVFYAFLPLSLPWLFSICWNCLATGSTDVLRSSGRL
ncbi:hypothetical protein GOP47_0003887 [Adiantum capillus-veneris]|uniref:Uncharacterized protein n=1 Tax=Adiantum capillus-veneris TaxID=13818 RepID=A0A9D4V704_ADICA|nr:hypothetical protein GOP47_0003887 [Adiantum capillus-veneris]